MSVARRILLAVLLVLPAVPARAAAQADSSGSRAPLFTFRDALLASGVLLGARFVHPLDDRYAARLQDSSTQANRRLQTLAAVVRTTAAPGAFIIGGTLYATGRLAGNRKLASLGLHGTEALIIGEVTASVLKGVVGRQRPNVHPRDPNNYRLGRGFRSGDDYRSFPSGHAVAAFAAAAAVSAETARNAPNTRWIVGPIMYGGAALVGASRMYNNRHWASDVLVGAGIGTFAGLKVVRYHDSHPRTGSDRLFLAGSLVPADVGGHVLRLSILPGSLLGQR